MDNILFSYKNDKGLNIKITTEAQDCSLQELVARFIEFTRLIGYQAGSWEKVVEALNEDGGLSSDYTAYDWASAVIYE